MTGTRLENIFELFFKKIELKMLSFIHEIKMVPFKR